MIPRGAEVRALAERNSANGCRPSSAFNIHASESLERVSIKIRGLRRDYRDVIFPVKFNRCSSRVALSKGISTNYYTYLYIFMEKEKRLARGAFYRSTTKNTRELSKLSERERALKRRRFTRSRYFFRSDFVIAEESRG